MTTYKVEGMHCQGCVRRVNEAMKAMQIQVEVSLEAGTVTVDSSDEAVLLKAKDAIEDLGFDVL